MKTCLCNVLFIFVCSYSFSQSQSDMNKEEQQKFLVAEKELNQVYQQILNEYKDDTAFTKNLRASQRLWLQFRQAEMKTMYPDREPGFYGSIYPMCLSIYKTELTEERVKKLKKWLDGQEEGNACGGSIRLKQ